MSGARAALLGLCGLLPTMASCGSTPPPPAAASACPQAELAAPADRIRSTAADGKIQFTAGISDLQTDCRLDETGVEVDLAFVLQASAGPGFAGAPVELRYFVTTLDPGQAIIGKQLFTSSLSLAAAGGSAGTLETATLRLPLPATGAVSSYRVYVGFQPG
jgi:hypothetical protein